MSNEEDFDALSKDDDDSKEEKTKTKEKDNGEGKESDEDEEEEEEDEEDEEDDEEENARPKKRSRVSDLLDLEASASDEDDEEGVEFDETELNDFVVGDDVDEDIDEGPAMHRELDRRAEARAPDAEAMARFNYEGLGYGRGAAEEQDDLERSNIRQQARQPTGKDPKLFAVKCKVGEERELCTKLLNKFFHLKAEEDGSSSKLRVYSIVSMDHLKGYLYIEADKLETARDFVMYINGIYAGKVDMVKPSEMVSVMTITKKKTALKRDDWVRIKRGLYKDDLARVTEYDPANERVYVKLIPRLDLDAWAKRETAMDLEDEDGRGVKRKRPGTAKTLRPPPRLFNKEEVKARGGDNAVDRVRDELTGEMYEVFDKDRYKDGFLYKLIKMNGIITNPPPPSVDDLRRFQVSVPRETGDDMDIDSAPNLTEQFKAINDLRQKRAVSFQRDDKVLVIEGELKNLVGRVVEVKGDEVRVDPLYDLISEKKMKLPVIPLAPHQLRKHFSVGAHVKVVAGEHNGETGIIVKISENVATLISDVSMSEVRVLASDLIATAEISSGAKIGDYSLFDLVHISANEVGVIIRIEGDKVVILDPNNQTRDVKLQALTRRRDTKAMVGKGHDGGTVGMNDKVRILAGPYRNESGVIKHVYRINSFVHIKNRTQNSGLVVVRNKHLVVAGEAASQKSGRPDVFGKSATSALAPRLNAQLKGRGKHNDPWLHKQVTIVKGPYKSYQGLVKDATDKDVVVELQSTARRVTISKDHVRDLTEMSHAAAADSFGGEWDPSKTPLRGDQTPLRVATPGRPMTPSHDPFNPLASGTPFRGDGSTPSDLRTPVGFERRTPAPMTPSGGLSYITPAPATPSSGLAFQTPMPSTPSGGLPYTTPAPPTPSISNIYSTPGNIYSTPGTPGLSQYSTPAATSAYATPRTMPTPLTAVTPGTPGLTNPRTPQTAAPFTPVPYSPAPFTPGGVSSYVETPKTPTEQPYGYSPAPLSSIATPVTPTTGFTTPMTALPSTPGSQYQEPSTPFAMPESEPENDSLRLFERTLVKLDGKVAIVRDVRGDTVTISFVEGNEQQSVPMSSLSIVTPEKKDPVVIVRGQFAGLRGNLIGIDMPDGIVKMDGGGEIKILKLSYLAKYSKA